MKKIIAGFILSITMLSTYSLYANQDNNDFVNEIKICLGADVNEYPIAIKAVKRAKTYVSTNVFAYQYTTDGWLQQVAVYADSVICTNTAGPRQGAQFIIMNNGAVMDMTNFYKQHSNRITHTYSWGEVNTYKDYQEVTFN